MYETLSRLWNEKKITEAYLDKAIPLGWITQGDKIKIITG